MCLPLYMKRLILGKYVRKYRFLLFFRKNANVSTFVEIQG